MMVKFSETHLSSALICFLSRVSTFGDGFHMLKGAAMEQHAAAWKGAMKVYSFMLELWFFLNHIVLKVIGDSHSVLGFFTTLCVFLIYWFCVLMIFNQCSGGYIFKFLKYISKKFNDRREESAKRRDLANLKLKLPEPCNAARLRSTCRSFGCLEIKSIVKDERNQIQMFLSSDSGDRLLKIWESLKIEASETCNIQKKICALLQSDGFRLALSFLTAFKSSSGWSLTLSDIRTLLMEREWLSEPLIQYYLGTIVAPQNKATILPIRFTLAMDNYADDWNGKWDTWLDNPLNSDDEELLEMIKDKNQFIGVIHKTNHWLFLYGKKNDDKLYIVDSGISKTVEEQIYRRGFHTWSSQTPQGTYRYRMCKAFNAKFKHIEGWSQPRTLAYLPSDKQKDTFNCGVFVIMNAHRLAVSSTLPECLEMKKSMKECRVEIAKNIMKYSLPVSAYCTECGNLIAPGSRSDLKVCANVHCNRHYHLDCIGKFMARMDEFKVRLLKYPYNLDLDVENWNCPACRPSSLHGIKAKYDDL